MNSKGILRLLCCGAVSTAMLSAAMGTFGISEPLTVSAAQAGNGDINSDGSVTGVDLMLMKSYMLGITSFDGIQTAAADMDGNAYVNIIDAAMLTQKLLGGSPDENTETIITLNGTSISVNGPGAVANGNVVTINAPGSYDVSGTLTNGRIIVDVDKTAYPDGEVEIRLNGANITCNDNSAIYVASVDKKCTIAVEKDTVNYVTDGSSYTNEDGDGGAIYSKDDLSFKGKGTLIVKGNCNDGIVSKDDLKIKNATIEVTAADDGLRGKDSVQIESGTITITAGGDGIKSTEDAKEDKGFVEILDGTITIKATGDAIDAANYINIAGGTIDGYTYEGSAYKGTGNVTQPQQPQQPQQGGWGWGDFGGGADGNPNKVVDSAKGFKAVKAISISGGIIKIDSSDDAVHSDGTVIVSGGELTISSADDAFHATENLTFDAGTINIPFCYEGFESKHVVVNDGNIRLYATDDAINAADPDASNAFGVVSNVDITINGGYVYIKSDVDGIDSNGATFFNGGTMVVYAPVDSMGEGALDSESTITANGGKLIAAGGKGYVQAPAGASSQNSVLIMLQGTTNSYINIKDSSGRDVVTFKSSGANLGSFVYCGPELVSGQTYTISTGGSYNGGTVVDGICTGGSYSGGTFESTFTVSGVTTLVGTTSNGFQFGGGGGGFGGWTW